MRATVSGQGPKPAARATEKQPCSRAARPAPGPHAPPPGPARGSQRLSSSGRPSESPPPLPARGSQRLPSGSKRSWSTELLWKCLLCAFGCARNLGPGPVFFSSACRWRTPTVWAFAGGTAHRQRVPAEPLPGTGPGPGRILAYRAQAVYFMSHETPL